jgi:hypothetical protein
MPRQRRRVRRTELDGTAARINALQLGRLEEAHLTTIRRPEWQRGALGTSQLLRSSSGQRPDPQSGATILCGNHEGEPPAVGRDSEIVGDERSRGRRK